MLRLFESGWNGKDSSDSNGAGTIATLVQNLEKLGPATLQHLKAIQEIWQDHLCYDPDEVSLHSDAPRVRWAAALVLHRTARLSTCGVATITL